MECDQHMSLWYNILKGFVFLLTVDCTVLYKLSMVSFVSENMVVFLGKSVLSRYTVLWDYFQ